MTHLLEEQQAAENNNNMMPLTIVFVERKAKCDEVASALKMANLKAAALHGGLGQVWAMLLHCRFLGNFHRVVEVGISTAAYSLPPFCFFCSTNARARSGISPRDTSVSSLPPTLPLGVWTSRALLLLSTWIFRGALKTTSTASAVLGAQASKAAPPRSTLTGTRSL